MAVRHCLAGGARRFVPSAESGGSCVLSAGAGFLLYLLLFLLYIDYADIYRIFVYCRIRVRVLQEAAPIVGVIFACNQSIFYHALDNTGGIALRAEQAVAQIDVINAGIVGYVKKNIKPWNVETKI